MLENTVMFITGYFITGSLYPFINEKVPASFDVTGGDIVS